MQTGGWEYLERKCRWKQVTISKNSNEKIKKRNEKDNCDRKNHEIIKKRHKKVKLKTNKGLQEGIFIFYFFNFCY